MTENKEYQKCIICDDYFGLTDWDDVSKIICDECE